MPIRFYLDAARMGRMTPSTQRTFHDFVRLTGESGCTLYTERFLRDGIAALPPSEVGPSTWRGIAELKRALAQCVGDQSIPPLLSGLTAKLVELSAEFLFRKCRRILVTDLTWPGYLKILQRTALQMGGSLIHLPCRKRIFENALNAVEFIDAVVSAFASEGCQGLFLPHVSHDGICLPVGQIAHRLRETNRLFGCVIDGAQAFGHVPIDCLHGVCDLYIAGAHKWLGAYFPLGIGFPLNADSRAELARAKNRVDDPLMTFLDQIEQGQKKQFGETVNVAPLLTCRAALADLGIVHRELAVRRQNAVAVASTLPPAWRPIWTPADFRAGILLVDAGRRTNAPDSFRELFLERGVALTVYESNRLRLSMPAARWTGDQLSELAEIFRDVDQQMNSLAQSA